MRRVATRAVAEPEVEAEDTARPVYPFSAIIGQEEMKFAAIMNIIDPNIGGIMVMGDRGTGKSTTVRALVDLLPLIDIVKDDAFMSSPSDPNLMSPEVLAKYKAGETLETTKVPINMVDLPLGATEDRVCGTIDIEKALTEGTKAFEPGLLAKANRGILYVDEVNLLAGASTLCMRIAFKSYLNLSGLSFTHRWKTRSHVRVHAHVQVFSFLCSKPYFCSFFSFLKTSKRLCVMQQTTSPTFRTTTSWTFSSTPPPLDGTPWSARVSPSATPPASSSSAPVTPRRVSSAPSCSIASACTRRLRR